MSSVTTATAPPPAEPAAHRRPRPVLHPFLFTIFPIAFLVAQNPTDDIRLPDVLWVLALSLAGAALVLGVARLVLRDVHAAGFVASGFVLLFFSFGRIDQAVDPFQLGRKRHALLLLSALLGLIVLLIGVRFRGRFARITPGLNLIASVLVLLNVVPIATAGPKSGEGVVGDDVTLIAPAHPRDVYYIIFDRYADEITLRDRYHYDNTPFLTDLGDRGFDVVTDAVANYPKTAHSLASSLNMTFLDGLVQQEGADSGDWGPVYASLQDFRVARALT